MDLVCPTDHICYVRCTYCNTLLAIMACLRYLLRKIEYSKFDNCRYKMHEYQLMERDSHCIGETALVGVPCNWLMDKVTVNCGHCNHLSFLDPRYNTVQSICPSSHHLPFQGACAGFWRDLPFQRSASTSSERISTAPFGMKMPKKHRAPSAYNHFMRDEIQRIKTANPDIPHREAFSMAAKNWAKCDPRNSANKSV